MRADRPDAEHGAAASTVRVPRPRVALDDRPPTGRCECGEVFVGRAEELALLASLAQEVRGGRPRVVQVEGPAGIGKTALVERFLRDHRDLRVLRCAGEREEAAIAFGVVDQLFLRAGATTTRLLGGREGGLPHLEPAVVGGQLLALLGERAEEGPLALLVDDVHWVDPESLRALLFALRRTTTGPVLALLLTRDGAGGPAEGLGRLAAQHGGAVLPLPPLAVHDVHALVAATAGPVPAGLAARLHAHTRGAPAHLREVVDRLPPDLPGDRIPALPVPHAVARSVRRLVDACPAGPRRLVEAAAVLGDGSRLADAAALAGVADPLPALEVAHAAGLLDECAEPEGRRVAFPHPLVRAAVYEQLGPAQRVRWHLAAAESAVEDGERLRHRVAAADPPDEALAGELARFAQRRAGEGAWSAAAAALVDASRMSATHRLREERLLQAVDVLAGTGSVADADAVADVAGATPGALRDAVLGHRAVLDGRGDRAEALLESAWRRCDLVRDPCTAALVAERCALHAVGRMRPAAVVEWARRSLALSPAENGLVGAAADDLLRVGLAWPDGPGERRAGAEQPGGWVAQRVWAAVWSSRAEFLQGAWDAAAASASRAVALAEEAHHEWLQPLARWAAVEVPAARGEWAAAQEHARAAAPRAGGYELMRVAGGLAAAQVAEARGDHEGVLAALGPVVELGADGVDGPGLWSWQVLYGDALVSAGRVAEAEAFLAPHEAAAAGRPLAEAMLGRVRGRLEAAAGRAEAAEEAFERASEALGDLPVPFPRALVELGFGQVLRRHGHRRAAAERLEAARERFAALGATPYVERCERELGASGLAPAKRRDVDPSRLTAQEMAVAQLVARGLSNRQVASELFVSVKTVQFHLTRIYSKLRIRSRVELAATYAAPPGPPTGARPRAEP